MSRPEEYVSREHGRIVDIASGTIRETEYNGVRAMLTDLRADNPPLYNRMINHAVDGAELSGDNLQAVKGFMIDKGLGNTDLDSVGSVITDWKNNSPNLASDYKPNFMLSIEGSPVSNRAFDAFSRDIMDLRARNPVVSGAVEKLLQGTQDDIRNPARWYSAKLAEGALEGVPRNEFMAEFEKVLPNSTYRFTNTAKAVLEHNPVSGVHVPSVVKTGAKIVDGVRDAGKLSSAANGLRWGGNVAGIASVALLTTQLAGIGTASASQLETAKELLKSGDLTQEGYDGYVKLTAGTTIGQVVDAAVSAVDPTVAGGFAVSALVDAGSGHFYKGWAEKNMPEASEKDYQDLSKGVFSGHSPRADMLLEVAGVLPKTTEGEMAAFHPVIDANNAYNALEKQERMMQQFGLSSVNGTSLEAVGQERESSMSTLLDKMDSLMSDPKNSDAFLDKVPVDARMEYVRKLARSEKDPEQFSKDSPKIAAYTKGYEDANILEKKFLGVDGEKVLSPQDLNDYIKARCGVGADGADSGIEAAPKTQWEDHFDPAKLSELQGKAGDAFKEVAADPSSLQVDAAARQQYSADLSLDNKNVQALG